jgi:hypothetical protein
MDYIINYWYIIYIYTNEKINKGDDKIHRLC